MIGHRRTVRRPSGEGAKLDWEVELVAVLGTRIEAASAAQALDAVAGYTIANDISVRDWGATGRHPVFGHRWLERKGRATLLPVGPMLVPARLIDDPMDLELRLEVNGSVRQRSRTSEMIFGIAEQVAYLSSLTALLPGDLILTGTPAGTASAHGTYLRDGDLVTATIERLGALENRIEG
jgi:2-keto-4-pentenoate hydratase/2-oxohepta-3-ene-1,7-dioic acid hydratase in catechol pathway